MNKVFAVISDRGSPVVGRTRWDDAISIVVAKTEKGACAMAEQLMDVEYGSTSAVEIGTGERGVILQIGIMGELEVRKCTE